MQLAQRDVTASDLSCFKVCSAALPQAKAEEFWQALHLTGGSGSVSRHRVHLFCVLSCMLAGKPSLIAAASEALTTRCRQTPQWNPWHVCSTQLTKAGLEQLTPHPQHRLFVQRRSWGMQHLGNMPSNSNMCFALLIYISSLYLRRNAVQACLDLPDQLLQPLSGNSTDAVHIVKAHVQQVLPHFLPLLSRVWKIHLVVSYDLQ